MGVECLRLLRRNVRSQTSACETAQVLPFSRSGPPFVMSETERANVRSERTVIPGTVDISCD
jgi:hypothetical protein